MTDKLYVDTIEPEGATTNLTIGQSGQDIIVTGNDIRANVVQDAGGNAIFTSDGSGSVSEVNVGFFDSLKLITSQTASSSAYIDFTTGIDSTYNEYIFKYYNIHPSVSNKYIDVSFSIDGGSNWGITKTTTAILAHHNEADTDSGLNYMSGGWNITNDTGRIRLSNGAGTDNDMCIAGELHLFNPSSTTYVKNYFGRSSTYEQTPMASDSYAAGYIDTTSAINAVRFQMNANNMDDGIIQMYGVA